MKFIKPNPEHLLFLIYVDSCYKFFLFDSLAWFTTVHLMNEICPSFALHVYFTPVVT